MVPAADASSSGQLAGHLAAPGGVPKKPRPKDRRAGAGRADAVWHVYILRCGDGTLYTGIAVDVEARFKRHASGSGARYTRGRGPLTLAHVERAGSHGDALRREAAIRRMGRAGKEALVNARAGAP